MEPPSDLHWRVLIVDRVQRIVPASKVGRRLADKLDKVWLRDGGTETWLLIHVEVERRPGPKFPERIVVYSYRIFDRYHRPVVSLVVLTDVGAGYRRAAYRVERWGFSHTLRFPPRHRLACSPKPPGSDACARPPRDSQQPISPSGASGW